MGEIYGDPAVEQNMEKTFAMVTSRHNAVEWPFNVIGCKVELHSLQASHLNGRQGCVCTLLDANGRIGVRLEDGAKKLFKPTNLRASSVKFKNDLRNSCSA